MSGCGRKVLVGAAVAAAAVAGSVAAACALVAPRRGDTRLDARWSELARHRYAHRGLHAHDVPENSLAAFRRARELGFGVELDVHLMLDGRLAVVHDSNLERVCGRAGVVEQLTLPELGEYRLLDGSGLPTSEGVPLLGEVLRLFELGASAGGSEAPPAPLIVELKSSGGNHEVLCERAMACLDSYDVRYCVESFDPLVVAWLRRNRPDVVRGQLAENFVRHASPRPWPLRAAGTYLLGNALTRPDFIAYRYEDLRNASVCLSCKVMGGHLLTWTIRNERDLLASEALGAPVVFEGFVPGPVSTIGPGTADAA